MRYLAEHVTEYFMGCPVIKHKIFDTQQKKMIIVSEYADAELIDDVCRFLNERFDSNLWKDFSEKCEHKGKDVAMWCNKIAEKTSPIVRYAHCIPDDCPRIKEFNKLRDVN